MNAAILIIQMFYQGVAIQHTQVIEDHGYLNRTVCLTIRNKVREHYIALGAEIIYVDCPYEWSEA